MHGHAHRPRDCLGCRPADWRGAGTDKRQRCGARGGGVRSFSLLALAGSIAPLLGSVATAVAGVFVGLAMFASYRRKQVDDPGLTTEVAMLATYSLGLLAKRSPALAGGIGVVVLTSKAHLHRFTRDRLSQQELHDALIFVAAGLQWDFLGSPGTKNPPIWRVS